MQGNYSNCMNQERIVPDWIESFTREQLTPVDKPSEVIKRAPILDMVQVAEYRQKLNANLEARDAQIKEAEYQKVCAEEAARISQVIYGYRGEVLGGGAVVDQKIDTDDVQGVILENLDKAPLEYEQQEQESRSTDLFVIPGLNGEEKVDKVVDDIAREVPGNKMSVDVNLVKLDNLRQQTIDLATKARLQDDGERAA